MTILCWFIVSYPPVNAATIKIATYNVNNLFDAVADGTEYPEYDPKGPFGWDRGMADIKATNIARVLAALKADIVCLQEVESRRALDLLLKKLEIIGASYPYAAIADNTKTTVKCAVISTCPIIDKQELSAGENMRSILQVTVECERHPLILFVNHWKSKQGPESRRMVYARTLKSAVDRLAPDADYIIIGDFNADYDEFITFRNEPRLNDTNGRTGINQVLGTTIDGRMVTEALLKAPETGQILYNLWLEVPPSRRWSYRFFGTKNSLDNIILPKGLYDAKGISYIDNSFDRFDPDFLYDRRGNIFRWQQADSGRGRHLGRGYSDHLPVFALFSTGPFKPRPGSGRQNLPDPPLSAAVPISALYKIDTGLVRIPIQHCVVIYKYQNDAIIKQPGGRAIYIYRAARNLEYGHVYDLTVTDLRDYHGLREICALDIDKREDARNGAAGLLLQDTTVDLTDNIYQNEVAAEISGAFRDGHLYYDDGRHIRLYFKNRDWEPPQDTAITLKNVRVGFHFTPELVIEEKEQIRASRRSDTF